MEISNVIESEREKWIRSDSFNIDSPQDINNGYCKQFAKGVKDVFNDNLKIETYNFSETYSSFSHAWIVYEGRHYDAECPQGVEKPAELPFFKRNEIKPGI